jgi:hypothetical protein
MSSFDCILRGGGEAHFDWQPFAALLLIYFLLFLHADDAAASRK